MQYRFFILIVLFMFYSAMLLAQPAGRDAIIFSHQKHFEELELDCDLCHESVFSSNVVSDRNLPEKDICMDCHDGDTALDECSLCHTNEDDPLPAISKVIPALKFSHRLHLEKKAQCINCHKDIESSTPDVRPRPIVMELCMDCHSTPQARIECYTCHETMKGKLPLSHSVVWGKTHGLEAILGETNNCSMCHQQSQCEDCHTRQQFEKRVHTLDFDFTHGFDFLAFSSDCSSCHEMPQFCSSCHSSQSVMPLSHNGIFWASTKLENGGNHGSEALDNPEYCIVCHEEPATDSTCQRCH